MWDPKKSHRLLRQRRLKEKSMSKGPPAQKAPTPQPRKENQPIIEPPPRPPRTTPPGTKGPQQPLPQPRRRQQPVETTTTLSPTTTTHQPTPQPRTRVGVEKELVEDLRQELGALKLGTPDENDHQDEDMRDVGGQTVGPSVVDVAEEEQAREKPPTPTPRRTATIGVGTRDGELSEGQTKIVYNYNYNYHYHYQCDSNKHNTVGGPDPLHGGGVGRRMEGEARPECGCGRGVGGRGHI